ncbi:MAG: NUDIX domain-containing protein [Defluviitaleaceae bacterium]|nr:NUDIX domain-containing protein [Defluviitaleaceae bacterium]
MSEPFRSFSAVFPLIIKEDNGRTKMLLHRRQNTGYQDGKLDIAASGHVDENETATTAAVRECKEELGIAVKAEDLTFVHMQHRLSADRTYYDIYFVVKDFAGTPAIMESEKCSELIWCDMDKLPDDVIACRRVVIGEYLKGNFYSERVE